MPLDSSQATDERIKLRPTHTAVISIVWDGMLLYPLGKVGRRKGVGGEIEMCVGKGGGWLEVKCGLVSMLSLFDDDDDDVGHARPSTRL